MADPAAAPRRAAAATRRGRPRTGVREALLRATDEILAESGAAHLSTREVARRAGAAESSIFYHFGDRLGLLQAVVRKHLPTYTDVAGELEQRAGTGELDANLVDLLRALELFYLRIMPIIAAMQSDSELRKLFADASRELNFGPHRALDPVIAYLEKERDAGRVRRDVDLRPLAMILVSVAHERAIQQHLSGVEHLPRPAEIIDLVLPLLVATTR